VAELKEWNERKIAEFRANGGALGGQFSGRPMLLLHTVGARTGDPRIKPLTYQPSEGGYVVFGSFGGNPRHPPWYHNLLAEPLARIELGSEVLQVRARVLSGAERSAIWETQKRDYPVFAEYETAAGGREIPVVLLERTP
jgi:deazaflavin-dependent oxidoreductase (nitroreductase family)